MFPMKQLICIAGRTLAYVAVSALKVVEVEAGYNPTNMKPICCTVLK